MSEQLYFLKINEGLVQKSLPSLLIQEHEFSFKYYIELYRLTKWTDDNKEEPIVVEEVINKIIKGIALLTTDEWDSIFFWLAHKADFIYPDDYDASEKFFQEELKAHGLDLFFELVNSTSAVRAFYDLVFDYDFETVNSICTGDEFLHFLNYSTCFMKELQILFDEYYHKDPIDEELVAEIAKIKQIDPEMYNLAESLFNQRKEEYIALVTADDNKIRQLAYLDSYLSIIKEKLGDYKDRVLLVHSF